MSDESPKTRALGNFFSRLGRRVRSKSPAVSRFSAEIPNRSRDRCVHAEAISCAKEVDCVEASHSPHSFGTFIHKLSRRRSKKTEKLDGHSSKDKSHTLPLDNGKIVQQVKHNTPRSAISENDLRHVTVSHGTGVDVTPMTGVSQSISEDNLFVANYGTPAHRVPSYIRVSCALNGYTKSPRYLEHSAARSMGRSLVERRLGMFETTLSDRKGPLNQIVNEHSCDRSDPTMGIPCSTPSPVRKLIAQFDWLQLCNRDKDNGVESCKPTESNVITQPISSNVLSHSFEKSAKCELTIRDEIKGSSDPPNVIGLIPEVPSNKIDMRTGEDFARLLRSVRSRLQASITQVLSELEEVESLPEEAESEIRVAAGKAQLLVRKKLAKFEELVKKHLADSQPATVDDLEGYWALVEIELHDINECFKKVDAWRASGWHLVDSTEDQSFVFNTNNNNITKKKKSAPLQIGTVLYGDNPSNEAKHAKTEKQKATAVTRKKALAEAKQKVREAQQMQTGNT